MKTYRLNPPVNYSLRPKRLDPPISSILFLNKDFRQLSYPLRFSPRLLNSLLASGAQNFYELITMIKEGESAKLTMFGQKSRQEINRIFRKQKIDLQW